MQGNKDILDTRVTRENHLDVIFTRPSLFLALVVRNCLLLVIVPPTDTTKEALIIPDANTMVETTIPITTEETLEMMLGIDHDRTGTDDETCILDLGNELNFSVLCSTRFGRNPAFTDDVVDFINEFSS